MIINIIKMLFMILYENMKLFAFDSGKREKLLKERNIDLEVIVSMIES